MNRLEQLFYKSEKPSRYIGGEFNSFDKPITDELIRFAFAFPDVYEVGMSHLGLHILYNLLNKQENIFCERVFSPWVDLEKLLVEEELPLFTIETRSPLIDMDFIGFTLQYELSYTNILNMFKLSNIPVLSKDRGDEYPIVIAGGSCSYNPEPMAEFIDLFVIGEAEESILELMALYEKAGKDKETFLKEAVKIEGIYVPKFYEPEYDGETYLGLKKLYSEAPDKIKKRIIVDFDRVYFPDQVIVPFMEVVHNRAVVEIFRGCTKGCRFCQAGMIYRPIREKSSETIKNSIKKLVDNTGYEEVSLSSLSTLDYSNIGPMITDLIETYQDDKIGISLPSLRLDSNSVKVLQEVQKIRKTGLTFAPEAGTQRLRDVINKGVTQDNLEKTMDSIFSLGWDRVKLYFMIGLPTETMVDIDGIAELAYQVRQIYRETSNRHRLNLTISTACFVPKPVTPFQWEKQENIEELRKKEYYLNDKIKGKEFKYNYHDPKTSFLEGVFARGDRRLTPVLLEAYQMGLKFDGWTEFFSYSRWMEAFEKANVNPEMFTRAREYDEVLPWDHIDTGVSKKYLIAENEKAKKSELTNDCRDGCEGCGLNLSHLGGVC